MRQLVRLYEKTRSQGNSVYTSNFHRQSLGTSVGRGAPPTRINFLTHKSLCPLLAARLVGWPTGRNPTKWNHPVLYAGPTSQDPSGFLAHRVCFTAVSPARQRAAKNLFSGYLFNGYRRLSSQVGYWIVPVVLGVLRPLRLQRSPHDILLFCRLFNIRLGKEVRHLPQQQGGSHCPLCRTLSISS